MRRFLDGSRTGGGQRAATGLQSNWDLGLVIKMGHSTRVFDARAEE
jgi:hypothetical protein